MTADLVTWLRAQLDEDERVARASIVPDWVRPATGELVHDDGVWTRDAEHGWQECRVQGLGIMIYDEGGHTRDQADHIARWDPARVLAEVAAKRRIIDLHLGSHGREDGLHECPRIDVDPDDGERTQRTGYASPCPTLLALAQVYAGRDGWREEWAT